MKRFPDALAEAQRLVADVDQMAEDPEVLLEKGKNLSHNLRCSVGNQQLRRSS
jgi:hypothetical protein